MAQNPLQQHFRQPKIYISLPSHGVYNKPGTIEGDTDRIPVFGMTGMDEIIMKTPDALLTGESTAQVIGSCCPAIKDPWDLSNLDTDLILTAIRIATFGSELTMTNVCNACGTSNDYNLDLNVLIDHYGRCSYDNKLVVGELKITTRPLTYQQSTEFSLRNFQLQQQLKQLTDVAADEQTEFTSKVFKELAQIRNDVFTIGVESVDTGKVIVTERAFISEWIENADRDVMEAIRKHIQSNQQTWATPQHPVKCSDCGTEAKLSLDLDQSNFFVTA
jgi:hypothetical protein